MSAFTFRAAHRTERSFGDLPQVLPAAEDGGRARVEARYEAGVLTVALPKREDAKPRTIAVQVR